MRAKRTAVSGSYDDLIHVMIDQEVLIEWLMAEGCVLAATKK